MRIIKHGNTGREFECDCMDCQARVALTGGDLTFKSDPRDGDAVTWSCPDCGKVNWVSVNVVPRSVMRSVPR